ncbi:GtrA family protein [Anaerocolumna sp. AGMB13025]|uniref:GtrA family protein n=1 Tax=Anaerocolumna sp. AGMB13025 TaxID=3039116 RepID=UPI00241EB7A7|nr:GtrA family protein [Anaerocolumna sp. AGMB13025]WFR56309.1 GtrA family protein [Anaerocolumna sp. AGMB13025]
MKISIKLIREIILYGIIGIISSGTDATLFTIMVYKLSFPSILSNCISVFVGIIISFILNINFNFKTKDRMLKRFTLFFSIGMVGLGLSTFIITLGERLQFNIFIVKLGSIIIVALIQYILNKFISFKKNNIVTKQF